MSEADVLRQMVLSFRVTELQVLLGFAGKNKTGKKNELQARALDLLRQRNTPIFMKIRELHKRYPSNNSVDLNSGSSTPSEPQESNYIRPTSPAKVSHFSMPHQSMMQAPLNMHHGSSQIAYRSGGSSKHSSMMSSGSGASTGFPVHPDVRFKALPFYDILAELLKPTSLCTAPNAPSRFQETNFVFHLTPQQANDVAMSRDVRPNIKNEYSVQIQLRFCLLETSCEQEDNFPPSICVKVNSKICPLPNPIPTNKPGVEPKRPSRPVNITNLCKLCPTVPNYVTVSWASEYGRAYVIGVYLVKRLNSSTLLQRLRSIGVRNPDHTRAMIKEKLQQDPDSEIATTSLRGSLMCPLGKMKMHIPCRAKTCNHLQCFDASLYLQMNEKKPTWICPVCDKPAIFKDLVIDGLFMEITTKAPSSCNEVQFHDDGNWTPLLAKKEAVTIGASSAKPSSSYSSPKRTATSQPEKEKKKQKVEVIDLTCDSSTDEYDDETDTSSPMAVYNTNSTTNSSQSNNNQFTATTNNENSSLNIPASIQVISLPSPSSLSSCSNSSNSSHSSNNSTSTNYSTHSASAPATVTIASTLPSELTTTLVPAVSSRSVTPHSAHATTAATTTTTNSASISQNHPSGNTRSHSLDGSSSSNQGNSSSTPISVQGSSMSNSIYPSMPNIIDGSSPAYYPPVSSPLHEFLNPMYTNYSSTFDLYSMLQNTEAERQISSYSTVPQSMGNRKNLSNTAPDVISLD